MDLHSFLHSERLFLESPYEQDGLLAKERVVTGDSQVVFDNFYRSKSEKIYCHICGGHRHHKGITGLFANGDRILFGSACARDFFGVDVFKHCTADLRRRTRSAHDRFLILEISNSVEDLELWMKSYRQLIHHVERAWIDMHVNHETVVLNILNSIQRNAGRLVEVSDIRLGGKATKSTTTQDHRILLSLTGSDAIRHLKAVSQRATLVDMFVQAVKSIRHEPSEQLFANLAGMFNKTVLAAQEVDGVISFTTDFFSPEKLPIICAWIERRRHERLRGKEDITPQNLEHKFRKYIGHGIEKPHSSLASTLLATGILDKVSDRKGRDQIDYGQRA